MKIIELTNNLIMPLNNEEVDLMARFTEGTTVQRNDLTDREQLIANQLTNKDVLVRINEDGKIYYKKRNSVKI